MYRVPLALRGVAVLLLAASTVAAQSPEPPAELPGDPLTPVSPDFLRQYTSESHHPLLNLMIEGQLASFDNLPVQDSSRIKPTPQTLTTAPKDAGPSKESAPVLESAPFLDGADGIGGPADGIGCSCLPPCPCVPQFLPFAGPPPQPPCQCRKCQRHRRHCCGGYGPGYGNPYLGWPCPMMGCGGYPPPYPYQGCCGHKCHRQHGCCQQGCGYGGYGYPYGGYGGGWGGMGYGGFMDGCAVCGSCFMPPPPPPCCCRHKCHRRHGCCQQGCGYGGYGYPYGGYGGGWGGMGYGGFMDGGWGGMGYGGMGFGGFMDGCGGGCFMSPPPPPCCSRKCHRKHGCGSGYGYAGCGYPGWPAYPVPGAYGYDDGCYNCNYGGCCGKHRCRHRRHCCQSPAPYPYWAYPMVGGCCGMGFDGMGFDGFMDGGICAGCGGADSQSAPVTSGATK